MDSDHSHQPQGNHYNLPDQSHPVKTTEATQPDPCHTQHEDQTRSPRLAATLASPTPHLREPYPPVPQRRVPHVRGARTPLGSLRLGRRPYRASGPASLQDDTREGATRTPAAVPRGTPPPVLWTNTAPAAPAVVELAGIEPASLDAEPGLLRVESARRFSRPRHSHRQVADRPSRCLCPAQIPAAGSG